MIDLVILLIKDISFFILIFFGLYLYQLFYYLSLFRLIKIFQPSSSLLIDDNNNQIGFTEYIYSKHKPRGIANKTDAIIGLIGWGIYLLLCAYIISNMIFGIALFMGCLLFLTNLIRPNIDEEGLKLLKEKSKLELLFLRLSLLFFNKFQNISSKQFYWDKWERWYIVIFTVIFTSYFVYSSMNIPRY
jgi:hypothetical protein